MTKFNLRGLLRTGTSPVATSERPTGVTFEGAPGYERDAKSELFLLAVTSLVSEDTFYEAAGERDARLRDPKPVKRGVADAAVRLYSERSLVKYDGAARGFRFADVLE